MAEHSPHALLTPDRRPGRAGVERAAANYASRFPATPLLPLDVDGGRIWCKAESLQPMGAFKLRGAWHRLTDLDAAARARGVVAFSSGNHAQGVAWAARDMGMAATIVMPADAPANKLDRTRAMGARVVTFDRATGDRTAIAAAIAAETGATVVPSFDDPWVIEGQGSAGVEAAAQLAALTGERFDAIVACCGGGGLSSGIALALPDADVTVVEPAGWDDMGVSLRSGHIVPVPPDAPPTACDALQTPLVSPLTFDVLAARGATGVAVSEAEVRHAMRVAFDRLRLVLEPGGAVALAAVLAGRAAVGRHTLVTLSGGNVDAAQFAAVLTSDD